MVRLGDVCEIVLGGTPSTKNPEYWGGGIPWLTPGEMRALKSCYVEHTERTLTQAGLAAGSRLCPARSVVLSTRAPIGYVFINLVPMATNQGCKTLVLKQVMLAEYLYYNLLGRTEELNALGTGTTFKELATKSLFNLSIPLPPLSVQREIVARLEKELGEADALAAKFKEIAENADAEFKAELDETFKNVEGEKVRLGDVCGFLTDGDWIESKDQSENGVRLIQTGNVGIGVFKAKESNAHYISEETFERLKCTEIFNGDVLVSRLPSPVGRACIVNGIEGRMITAVDCSIIRFKDVVVKEYFVAYSQTQGYQAAIDVLTTGTTRARISRKNLASIPVPLLPLSVQREIITKLDAARERCDKLKAAAERGLRAAEDLRKAILAEAFEQ